MSIKLNFLYSSILTVSNYIFPLITFPYLSRILGPNNIGVCNFIDSVVNLFILFSMMGMGYFAVREIACNNSSSENRSKAFLGLFVLNLITTVFALIVLILCFIFIPRLNQHLDLFIFGAFKLLFNFLLFEWFFRGVEDFKYITNRSLIIKVVYVVSVFILVKDKNDYDIYYILSTLVIAINALFNIIRIKKYIRLKNFVIQIRTYIKPYVIYGMYSFLTSMYTSFNVVFLGFVTNDIQVGYYTTVTKLYGIILAFFTAFTTVMLPRMSSLIAQNNTRHFLSLIDKSLDFLYAVTFPLIIVIFVYSNLIVDIIAGSGLEGAYIPLKIVSILLFINGYEQIIIIQILMPLKKDKSILFNSLAGAIIGLTLNVLLVSSLACIGSSLVWLASEIVVLACGQYFVTKYTRIYFPYKKTSQYLLLSLPLFLIVYVTDLFFNTQIGSLFINIPIIILYSLFIDIYIMKNSFAFLVIDNITKIIKK